jgi:tRNA pseudouridine38-40 synthase
LVAVWIWYRGEPFRGFQVQVEGPTVQGELRRCLAQVGIETTPCPAGRTDRGVHARMQVVSFRAPAQLSPEELMERLRPSLPPGIGLCVATHPPVGFHPQWRCVGKEYRYRIALGRAPAGWKGCSWDPAQEARLGGISPSPERLDELLRACEGTRDFYPFHESSSARGPRTLTSARLVELGEGLFEARLSGDRFGRYQVRYLVGSALATAAGVIDREQFTAALTQGVPFAGLKAPAQGLLLWEARYPPQLDPFSPLDRAAAPGLPNEPPFATAR